MGDKRSAYEFQRKFIEDTKLDEEYNEFSKAKLPELVQEFVNHPRIKPAYDKYVQEKTVNRISNQKKPEQERPELSYEQKMTLARSPGGTEKLREWGYL